MGCCSVPVLALPQPPSLPPPLLLLLSVTHLPVPCSPQSSSCLLDSPPQVCSRDAVGRQVHGEGRHLQFWWVCVCGWVGGWWWVVVVVVCVCGGVCMCVCGGGGGGVAGWVVVVVGVGGGGGRAGGGSGRWWWWWWWWWWVGVGGCGWVGGGMREGSPGRFLRVAGGHCIRWPIRGLVSGWGWGGARCRPGAVALALSARQLADACCTTRIAGLG